MRRTILRMIASNALAAFSVQPNAVAHRHPFTRVRATGEAAAGQVGAAGATVPRPLPPMPPPGGKILPRGSLLDLSA